MRQHTAVRVPSDIELLMRVRSGDPDAVSALTDRHRRAVQSLPDRPGAVTLEASAGAVVLRARTGDGLRLPFRAAWLAQQAHGGIPAASADDAVWTAYVSLPLAWRLALWHREVEGQKPAAIAGFLGMSERETVRALTSAYAAMKRQVAIAHSGTGLGTACEEYLHRYRFSPPAVLGRRAVRELREHGRRCDDCIGLVRDLFVVEHTLRHALAEVVLGSAADCYLRRRPKVSRLRVPAAPTTRRLPIVVGGRARPALAVGSIALVSATAMTLALANPGLLNRPDPADVGAAPGVSGVAPGLNVGTPAPGVLGLTAPGAGLSLAGSDRAASDDGPRHEEGPDGSTGAAPGPGPDDPDPVLPDPGDTVPEPEPPVGPATPGPGEAPPDVPPAPDDATSVDVGVSPEEVAVAVDAGPTGPVVVNVPVPVPDPEPELPVVGLPLAPDTGGAA